MKNKKIICIPFAYKPNMQSGENVFSSGDKRKRYASIILKLYS